MGAPMRYQPQGLAKLNASHPLARYVAFVLNPGSGRVDLVSGKAGAPIPSANSVPPTGCDTGRALSFDAATYLDFGQPSASADMVFGGGATWLFLARPSADGGLARRDDDNSVNVGWAVGFKNSTGQLYYNKEYSTTNKAVVSEATPAAFNVGRVNAVVVTDDGTLNATGSRLYLNGTELVYGTRVNGVGAAASDAARNLFIGKGAYSSTNNTSVAHFKGLIGLVVLIKKELTPAEVASISANPWALFDAGSGGSAYQSAIAASSVASPPAGTALSVAAVAIRTSASASLTTQPVLTTVAASRATAAAALSTAMPLAANAFSPSLGVSSLTVDSAWAASASAGTNTLATLTTQTVLATVAASSATAAAALSTAMPLAANTFSPSLGMSSLTVGSAWMASASAGTNTLATLSTSIALGATAQPPSNAAVALSSIITLATSTVSKASGAAALTTQAALAAIAAASTSSATTLSTGAALAAFAMSRSAGNTALTVVPLIVRMSLERTFVVAPQSRRLAVPPQNRCFSP